MAIVLNLRPAFKRIRTFQWFVTTLAGISVREDMAGGVSSVIRSMSVSKKSYTQILHFFQSGAINLKHLRQHWCSPVLDLFSSKLYHLSGKIVLLGDGLKISKEGKCMPGVKLLHQSSGSNSKAEWIMGHSLQGVSLLVSNGSTELAVPLACRIHEGIRTGGRARKTLMDKFFTMLMSLGIDFQKLGAYLLADSYYCKGDLAKQFKRKGIELITRVRKNAVAYFPVTVYQGKGRPRIYGRKVKLWDFFTELSSTAEISVYGEAKTIITYGIYDLIWKSYRGLVRFCLVNHPTRGKTIFMTTDLSLTAEQIVVSYSKRFKIEYSFKELKHNIGAFCYRFWIMGMKKTRRSEGDRYIHREPQELKHKISIKMFAYHLYIQIAIIAQGLCQYLSLYHSDEVRRCHRTWLRTIRPGISASVQVTQRALKNMLQDFRQVLPAEQHWQKFAKKLWGTGPPNEKNVA